MVVILLNNSTGQPWIRVSCYLVLLVIKKAINCFIKYTPFPLAYDFSFSSALPVVTFILLYTLIISGNNFVDFVNGFLLAVGIIVLNYLFCCLQ